MLAKKSKAPALIVIGGVFVLAIVLGTRLNRAEEARKKAEEARKNSAVVSTAASQTTTTTSGSAPTSAVPKASTAPVEVAPAKVAVAPPIWAYESNPDPMGGGDVQRWAAQSSTIFELKFPYANAQRGTLVILRQKEDVALLIGIERGQILCSSFSKCSVRVRFDDSDQFEAEAQPQKDGDTTTIHFKDPKPIVEQIAKSRIMRIALMLYQHGQLVLEFPVAEPERLPAASPSFVLSKPKAAAKPAVPDEPEPTP